MSSSYYHKGSWNCICDICGFKFKSHQLRERWDGHMVCADDFEYRHPMDFLRVREDNQNVPWTRPEVTSSGSAATVTYYINGAAINMFTLG